MIFLWVWWMLFHKIASQLCSGCCEAREETPSHQPLSWRATALSRQQAAGKEARQGRTIILHPLSFFATIILLISGAGEGRVVYCSGFWTVVGFLDSDIHPGQSGERIRVSNYSSHPRTQCSASHILTISKTRETTHTPTEYFYTHWKPHTKWKVIKQFGLKKFFYFEFMSSMSLSSLSYKICKFYNATSKVH